MMHRLPLAWMAILLVGAGCAAAPGPSPSPAAAAPTPPTTATAAPTPRPTPTAIATATATATPTASPANGPEAAEEPHPWLDTPLTDVLTGQTFRLSDFAGRPVVVEVMAVWCPTCLQQQQYLARSQGVWGEEVVIVSLDIDPYEDASLLRDHATRNGFQWRWAIAPREMASRLSQSFGPLILSPPSTPVFWLDAEQRPTLLPPGLKLPPTLLETVPGS